MSSGRHYDINIVRCNERCIKKTPTRERATQEGPRIKGKTLTPTKYRTEPKQEQWYRLESATIPYDPSRLFYRMLYKDGTEYYTFDIDNPGYLSDSKPEIDVSERLPITVQHHWQQRSQSTK